jgi:hypothetical protein
MWFRTEGLAPVLMYLAVYPNGKQFFWSNQFLFDNNYAHNTWIHLDLPLGPETNATTIFGDQNSWNSPITWIYWSSHAHGNGTTSVLIDDLYFHSNCFSGTASDLVGAGSSGVLYGQRDYVYQDNRITSDAQAANVANTLLYLLKNPVTRVKVPVAGNTNILLGDQLALTIPQEGLSAASFDVLSVDHYLAQSMGFRTEVNAVASGDQRKLSNAPMEPREVFKNRLDRAEDLARGLTFRG